MAAQLGALAHSHFFGPISQLGKQTVIVNLASVDAVLEPLALGNGMELGIAKYMITLFLAYPFSFIFGLMPCIKPVKHFLSFVIGFIFVQWVFGPDWIHSFLTALFTYGCCIFAPRKVMGPLAFWTVLAYMVACHAYKMYMNGLTNLPYWQYPLDFTGCQMVLTMKLTSFAYNVADGKNLKEKGAAAAKDDAIVDGTGAGAGTGTGTGSKRVTRASSGATSTQGADAVASKAAAEKEARKIADKERVEASQRSFALASVPTPLEFLGYVYCFNTIMVGPTFEYAIYEKVIAGVVPAKPEGKGTPAVGIMQKLGRLVNSNMYVAAMHRLLLAVCCMAGYQVLADMGYLTYHSYDPAWIAGKSYVHLFWQMCVCMMCQRFKFYFIWKIAEGACILGGFGFSGYDKNGESLGYRATENMDILGFILSTNVQVLSRCWNKGTQFWLERYSYNRLNKSTLWVYLVSSVWHGVYPGFFIMFLSLPVLTAIERLMKSKINPRVVPEFDGRNLATYPTHAVGTAYWYACWLGQTIVFNYVVMTFSMGWWSNSVIAMASYDWIPYYTWFGVWAVLTIIPAPKSKKD